MRNSHWHVNSFNPVSCSSEYSKDYFILNAINACNKSEPDSRISILQNLFGKSLLKFIRPAQANTFNINNVITNVVMVLEMSPASLYQKH